MILHESEVHDYFPFLFPCCLLRPYYELPVIVLMLQTASKCCSVFMSWVLFERCFIIE